MKYKDYYKVMGVDRGASQEEIKRSYRKLARKFHPDVSKEVNAEDRFKEVGEAYKVLKDPDKRSAYDQLGQNWNADQEFRPPPDWDSGFEFRGGGVNDAGAAEYSDFFSTLFGQGFRPTDGYARDNTHRRGEDHHAKVLIEVEDAYHGATRSIALRRPEIDSSGHLTNRERILNVKIPKGVTSGQRIRLSGQGAAGLGGAATGDLYLEIGFKPHAIYKPDGRDIRIDLPITPWEAALGATVKVPTPAGAVNLSIPAGTNSGGKLRLKGRGIPGEPAGDFYAAALVTVPAADSDAAKALYRNMEETMAYNPRSDLGV